MRDRSRLSRHSRRHVEWHFHRQPKNPVTVLVMSMQPPAPVEVPEQKVKEKDELAKPWKVIVLNDPVNLMSYVVMVFKKVFGYDDQKATRHMREVHEQGRSLLWVGEREVAESYLYQLHQWRLQAILEQDD